MYSIWTNLFSLILDCIYPRYCYACKCCLLHTEHRYLCLHCWRKFGLIRDKICLQCGLPLGVGVPQKNGCFRCNSQHFYFDEVRSACRYESLARDFLLLFKYQNMPQLCYLLAGVIAWQIRRNPFPSTFSGIIPVPMFPKDERKRGYNQAELIALVLARILKIPCYRHGLIKARQTNSQAGLTKAERKKNLTQAFSVHRHIQKKITKQNILLVDDVFTTGSTVNECSHTLKKAGVKTIYIATVARSILV